MAVTGKWYGQAIAKAFNKEVDWDTDDIRCTLHAVGYVPDQDTHDYVDDLSSELATANGYTVGGQALAGKTLTYTIGTNTIKFDANDVVWTAAGTLTARSAVVSDRTPGTAATQPLLVYQLSDADVSATDGTLTVQWNASGIAEVVVS